MYTASAIPLSTPEQRERTFFLVMALAIASTVIAGFSAYFAHGNSSFHSPWWVHLHAVSFVSWITLFALQNSLVYRDKIADHRKLGRIGAGLAAWMVLLGIAVTPASVLTHRVPPFFTAPFFLALDWVNIVFFAGLISAGIALHKKTDWHRRLMFCATVCVITPAIARLLVVTNTMSPLNITLALQAFVLAGVVFDLGNRGRLHPAYIIGSLALLVMGPVTGMVAGLAPVISLASYLSGG